MNDDDDDDDDVWKPKIHSYCIRRIMDVKQCKRTTLGQMTYDLSDAALTVSNVICKESIQNTTLK